MKHSGKVIIASFMAMFLYVTAYAQQTVTGVVSDFQGGGITRRNSFRST